VTIERLLRAGGVLIGVLLGFATGVWEVFLSPLYAGAVPLPVSPVLAIGTNLGLVWFTYTVTGRKGFALLPGVAWFAAMLIGATKTGDGDVPIPGNDWMGLAAILLGGLAWGIAGYRLILPTVGPGAAPAPPVVAAPAPAPRAPKPGPKPGARPGSRRPARGRRR
jgi:hypothetical protein